MALRAGLVRPRFSAVAFPFCSLLSLSSLPSFDSHCLRSCTFFSLLLILIMSNAFLSAPLGRPQQAEPFRPLFFLSCFSLVGKDVSRDSEGESPSNQRAASSEATEESGSSCSSDQSTRSSALRLACERHSNTRSEAHARDSPTTLPNRSDPTIRPAASLPHLISPPHPLPDESAPHGPAGGRAEAGWKICEGE